MLRDPQGRRSRSTRSSPWSPAWRVARRWASCCSPTSTTTRPASCSSSIDKPWIPFINSRYIVGLDGISLPLLALTVLVVPLCIIYSWNHFPEPQNPKAFLILILDPRDRAWSARSSPQDLILFFVFFEVVLLPMYFMIGVWGGEQRQYASIKFFLYTLFGSALMIVSFLALYFLSDQGAGRRPAGPHLRHARCCRLAAAGISTTAALLIFGGMFMGFGIKVPIFPFHTWLPDAHTQAPTRGLGDPGRRAAEARHLRLHPHRHPDPARRGRDVGAVHRRSWRSSASSTARSCCLAQTDMKRLIAFSSVAHMGFVMLGIATLTTFGINAAIFGMVAHGLITGMLFFVAGSVKERYHTLEIKRLGGMLQSDAAHGLDPRLLAPWPRSACPAWPGSGASSRPSCRPTARTAASTSALFRVYMVVAAIGTVLAAGYLLWLYQRTAFGTPTEEFADDPHIHDVDRARVDRLGADARPASSCSASSRTSSST